MRSENRAPIIEIELPSFGRVRFETMSLKHVRALFGTIDRKGIPDEETVRQIMMLAGKRLSEYPDGEPVRISRKEVERLNPDELEQIASTLLKAGLHNVTGCTPSKTPAVTEPIPAIHRFAVQVRAHLTEALSQITAATRNSLSLQIADLSRIAGMTRGILDDHLQMHDAVRRAYGSQMDAIARAADLHRALLSSATLESIQTFSARQAQLTQNLLKLSELQKNSVDLLSAINASGVTRISVQMQKLFHLPDVAQFANLRKLLSQTSASVALKSFELPHLRTIELAKAMSAPWVRLDFERSSVKTLVDLAALGNAVKQLAPFDETLTSAVRKVLGDWRTTTIPEYVLNSLAERSKFYEGLGFNPNLTEFPPEAFRDAMRVTKLRPTRPLRPVQRFLTIPETIDELLELLPEYMKEAYAVIFTFESNIRQFIDREMRRAFGSGWIQHQVPGEMLDRWQEKHEKASDRNRGAQLISYADFTDYVQIICRTDNWKTVFQQFFGNKSSVQESFARLFPLRIDTMHARPLANDDILLLYVEVTRLFKAFRAK